ncbi:MAG: hypothetical protein AAFP90_03725, partial [Planctomycetota bacterium]
DGPISETMVSDPPTQGESKTRARNAPRRVLASEIMRVNSAVSNLIASGKSAQILSSIESGSADGMRTLDQNLAELLLEGMISERTASAYAQNPQIVQERFARLKRGGSAGRNRGRSTSNGRPSR